MLMHESFVLEALERMLMRVGKLLEKLGEEWLARDSNANKYLAKYFGYLIRCGRILGWEPGRLT